MCLSTRSKVKFIAKPVQINSVHARRDNAVLQKKKNDYFNYLLVCRRQYRLYRTIARPRSLAQETFFLQIRFLFLRPISRFTEFILYVYTWLNYYFFVIFTWFYCSRSMPINRIACNYGNYLYLYEQHRKLGRVERVFTVSRDLWLRGSA